jgi:glycosyltransferase involved in cell wall biosynthesis
MTILFLAMEFPPMNAAGVFRPLRFIKGLHAHGIRSVVITFEIDEFIQKRHKKFDEKLLQQVPADVPVIRIPLKDLAPYYNTRTSKFVNTYFTVSDNFKYAWRDNLFDALPAIIEKYQPQGIIATAPPFGASVLAAEIATRYHLPLIQDMRDAWAKLSMMPLGSYFHYLVKRNLERKAFQKASAIITVTPQLRKMFTDTHPGMPKDKFHLIYNSFDFDLPASLQVRSESIDKKEVFNIGYVGGFYFSPESRDMMLRPWYKKKGHRMFQYTPVKEDWLYRSPYFFFKALKRLLDKHPQWKQKIRFHHIGETPAWLAGMAQEAGVGDNLVTHGFQPQEKTIELQNGFDVLLATSEKVIGDEHYCLPSKLFTYLRSGKPALAFLTKGVQHEFISESKMGPIADPDNETEAVAVMEKLLLQGYSASLDMNYLQQFERDRAIQQLVAIVKNAFAKEFNPITKAVTA